MTAKSFFSRRAVLCCISWVVLAIASVSITSAFDAPALSIRTTARNLSPPWASSSRLARRRNSRSKQTFQSSSSSLDADNDDSTDADKNPQAAAAATVNGVRFLGKGEHAIVRPGVVLVAPTHEYHHYYRQAAIFVYAMGEDDDGVYVVRGVIIDHPTPFTLKEMIQQGKIESSPLGDNLLFRGGDKGGEIVILLHNREELGQAGIGVSGIYQGGWDAALAACSNGEADVGDFKVFFNYCEFTEQEMEDLLQSDEDGDSWAAVEVDADLVLGEDWDRGDCWKRLRNAVAQNMM